MLFHHDSRDYKEAASEAAKFAKDKLNKEIQDGLRMAGRVIDDIENLSIEDSIAKATALKFTPKKVEQGGAEILKGIILNAPKIGEKSLHRSALQQITQKARIPVPGPFFDRLLTEEPEEAAHLLNTLYHKDDGKFLLRSVGKEVRGFLSDRYKRYDSRPLFHSFLEACKDVGAVPYFGHSLDTKFSLKAVIPKISEPIENEVLAYGVNISHSDFGHGALEIRAFVDRLWCTNKAIMRENIRSVHLGSRLEEDIVWSQKTYEQDTQLMASKIKDMVQQALSSKTIGHIEATIIQAHQEKVDPKKIHEMLGQKLSKKDIEQIHEKFISDDVELLPAKHTKWRLSNAISWFANQVQDGDKQLDLMRLAGNVLPEVKTA